MNLSGKVIFIISYENWGAMRMSKHHYAIELAKAGNTVYFINHPDKRKELKRGQVQVLKTEFDNLFHVVHRLFHPYFFKFRLNHLYNLLTAFHIRKLIRIAGKYPDIVWSFDAGNSIPLKYFYKSAVKIFMPVDGPFGHDHEKRAAEDADVIISVTETILNAYKKFNKPKLLVNHGVADVFLYSFNERRSDDTIRVGYSGSLIRSDLDTKIFLKLIN
ncbi:MAG TPA: hypothetical protein VM101_03280, partial [Flavitalea sp.]|nr:hypothetical protein [Flavitalea sp.]